MTAAGFLVALAASVANAFALAFQAAEDRLIPEGEKVRFSLFARLLHQPQWVAGTALMVLAWPLQILALGLAPITVVQPTLASTQLVLLVIARTRLRERVGPLEIFGAMAIAAGVAAVIIAAPRHSVADPVGGRLVLPLTLVGAGAVAAFLIGRAPNRRLALVLGAGLAYAWVDFVNKLLSNDVSSHHWGLAIAWLAATIVFGALALLEETSALQQRPAVTVAPVIGAIQDPLPVLLALWTGVETWGNGAHHLFPLAGGLALVTLGGVLLGRSKAVAKVAGEGWRAAGRRPPGPRRNAPAPIVPEPNAPAPNAPAPTPTEPAPAGPTPPTGPTAPRPARVD